MGKSIEEIYFNSLERDLKLDSILAFNVVINGDSWFTG